MNQRRVYISGRREQTKEVSKRDEGSLLPEITLALILEKLFHGLNKLFVAIKYQFHQSTSGIFQGKKMPWFKLGIIGVVVFLLIQRDIQFSINMQEPQQNGLDQVAKPTKTSLEEMSFAPSFSPSKKKEGSLAKSLKQINNKKALAYINRFSRVAKAEMQKFGIPASVKMAQALAESWAGENQITKSSNNHFAAFLPEQEFNSAWESWRAHSLLLKEQHGHLFNNGFDYKKWTSALDALAFNKDKGYDEKLNEIIEYYQLFLLDEI